MDASALNAAAMTERLIDAAIYYEQCDLPYRDSARKELSEARSAIEAALASAPAPASGGADAVRQRVWSGVNPDGSALHPTVRQEMRDLLASLSPAATPVSEAEPVAWIDRSVLGELRKHKSATATVCSPLLKRPFGDPVALYLAKPASSPAGGDVVETLVPLKWRHVDVEQFEAHSIIGTYEVCGQHWSFVPTLKKAGAEMGSLDEARKAAQSHRDMYGPQPRRAALSQSTSAGRVGE